MDRENDKLEQTGKKPESNIPKHGVFLMRAEGQSKEDFKAYCIKRFKEAGLIKEKT